LRQHTKDSSDAAKLEEYAKSDKYSEILHSNTSVLDLLEQYSNINLPFEKFLGLLQPLRLRHYSISSSPLPNARICTLTYSVIDEPSTVDHQKRFQGVTGTYLRSLGPGDQILVSIRSTNKFFHLPIDMDKTPIMMFCAGSGIAPFRGFIQERAVLIQEGNRKLAPALLFVGCRSPKTDRLYGDQFDEWVRIGAVDIRYAFSRDPDASQGCKYIQDRLIKDKEEVYNTWDSGAKVFICGSGQLAKEFGQAARTVIKERMAAHGKDISDEKLNDWIANMRNDRFVADVFS
jgi:cytochrome P450/NADPH-cytochrome P450 reductase